MSELEEIRTLIRTGTTDAAIRAFEELDPLVVALAPDAPEKIMTAWCALHALLPPEYIKRRKARQEAEYDARRATTPHSEGETK